MIGMQERERNLRERERSLRQREIELYGDGGLGGVHRRSYGQTEDNSPDFYSTNLPRMMKLSRNAITNTEKITGVLFGGGPKPWVSIHQQVAETPSRTLGADADRLINITMASPEITRVKRLLQSPAKLEEDYSEYGCLEPYESDAKLDEAKPKYALTQLETTLGVVFGNQTRNEPTPGLQKMDWDTLNGTPPERMIEEYHTDSESFSDYYPPESDAFSLEKRKKTPRNKRQKGRCADCHALSANFFDCLIQCLTAKSSLQAISHTTDFHELRSSKGCPFCSLLFQSLRKNSGFKLFSEQIEKYNDPGFNVARYYDSHGCTDHGASRFKGVSFALKIKITTPSLNLIILSLHFSLALSTAHGETGKATLQESLSLFSPSKIQFFNGLNIPLDLRPGLEERLLILKTWFGQPAPLCGVGEDQLPRRLLEITGQRIRLISTSSMHNSSSITAPAYVALSHRWGFKQHLTTTKQTLLRHLKGIDLSTLPPTFRDAITITTHLGMSYIWIDALCILQDSKEDWSTESLKMGDVFQGAQVVLAAHCADNDSEGFLLRAMSKNESVLVSESPRVFAYLPPNFDADVTHSQLSKRGWVVQERFLATRTIHFTENHIYWETLSETRSEEAVIPTLPTMGKVGMKYFSPSAARELGHLLSPMKTAGTGKLSTSLEWLDLVEMYSYCDLTMEGDKLIALSGIARVIQKNTGVPYCAGIWADNICAGLLWLSQSEALIAPQEPRAPSWSWAAYDGPIQYPDDIHSPNFEPSCKILALNGHSITDKNSPTRESANRYWLNGPGTITLEGQLMDLADLIIKGTWAIETLGPGPKQLVGDFPRMPLHSYVSVHPIRDVQRFGTGIMGWVALDDQNRFGQFNSVGSYDNKDGKGAVFLKVASRGELVEKIVFGIFLVRGNGKLWKRIGFGQMRECWERGGAGEGRKKFDEPTIIEIS